MIIVIMIIISVVCVFMGREWGILESHKRHMELESQVRLWRETAKRVSTPPNAPPTRKYVIPFPEDLT